MADLLIRKIEERDVEAVGRLWYQLSLYHENFARYYAVRPDTEAILGDHVRDLMHRNCIFFVAEAGGRVVGFVSGYIVMRNPQLVVDRVGKVDNIFVDDEFRGKGIGTQLLEQLFAYIKSQNVVYIELSCDFANDRALELYKRLGFKEQKVFMVREG